MAVGANSNTTLVKVKYGRGYRTLAKIVNSNTTLVKVKLGTNNVIICFDESFKYNSC